jgi:hypothetical protein
VAGTAVDFALTRFEAVDGARLEVEGRWSGVRGMRFVRPALVVRGEGGGERTLLADLEHKPWLAEDGETWIAAFPWTGEDEPDVDRTELAVAPSIVVPLAGGARRAPAAAPAPRSRSRAPAPPAAPSRPDHGAQLGVLRKERDRLAAAASQAATDLDALRAERDGLRRAGDELRQERDELRQERDAAVAARDATLAERDAALAERDSAVAEVEALRRRPDAGGDERDAALAERDAAVRRRRARGGRARRRERAPGAPRA